ncbi:hypothetical protein L3X38_040507 [Prunus dulcis]|uniref:Uncharacterized protein n=1 Tax=Prunus dulcis TaxID=3755 RepID=A0AAD4YTK2_PRUDU|nr:hypothetical protein L3X38_040507 [Prunus dulcis]
MMPTSMPSPKRIQLFESIQAQQHAARQSLPSDPIKITLPDGKVEEGKKWITSPFDIASLWRAMLSLRSSHWTHSTTMWMFGIPSSTPAPTFLGRHLRCSMDASSASVLEPESTPKWICVPLAKRFLNNRTSCR